MSGMVFIGLVAGCAHAPSGALRTRMPASDDTPWSEPEALASLRKKFPDASACEPANPGEKGLRCIVGIPGYSQPVAILAPLAFNPAPYAPIHYIVHLHGYTHMKKGDETLAGILDYFDFLTALDAYGSSDALMIVPGSEEKCATYEDYFGAVPGPGSRTGAFEEFMSAVVATTGFDASAITLTGHSGAFRAMQSIIAESAASLPSRPGAVAVHYAAEISAIGLFDATYWMPSPELERWVKDPTHRMYDVYRYGSDTDKGSKALEAAANPDLRNAVFVPIPGTPPEYHWPLVKEYYSAALKSFDQAN